jgi:hypothetical protein
MKITATVKNQNHENRQAVVSMAASERNCFTLDGDKYFYVCRKGTNMESGKIVYQFENDNGDRIWATGDATMIWED